MNDAGQQLIAELRRRGSVGAFFDYAGYRRLRKAKTWPQARALFREYGYRCPDSANDAAEILDYIGEAEQQKAPRDPWLWIALEPTGLIGMCLLPVQLFTWAHRLRQRVARR